MKINKLSAELILAYADDKTKIRILSELLFFFLNGFKISELQFKLNEKKLEKRL